KNVPVLKYSGPPAPFPLCRRRVPSETGLLKGDGHANLRFHSCSPWRHRVRVPWPDREDRRVEDPGKGVSPGTGTNDVRAGVGGETPEGEQEPGQRPGGDRQVSPAAPALLRSAGGLSSLRRCGSADPQPPGPVRCAAPAARCRGPLLPDAA